MPLSKIVAKSITDDTITTDQIADTSVHGRRNLIINGAMQVAQRGDQTGVTDGYACDRFNVVDGSTTAVIDASQSSTSPDGFANSLKVDVTTAQSSLSSNSINYIRYKFEGQDIQQLQYGTSSAKKITLSFWVRSSTTGTYVLSMFANDSSRTNRQTYTIDSADTWERKTLTFNGDTSNGFDDDNALSLTLHWVLAVGSGYQGGTLAENTWGTYANNLFGEGQTVNLLSSTSNDFYITGVQLETGEQATPFEHRSKHDEYMRCLRYLYRIESNANYTGFAVTRNWSGTNAGCPFPMPVPLRVSPTLTTSTPISGNFDYSVSAISVAGSQPEAGASGMGVQAVNLDVVGSFTNGGAAQLGAAGTTNEVFLQFDAEL